MNTNNRPKTLANVPRTLRPKAVSVSPIKSPLGNVVPQMVLPLITSQGQGQYVPGSSIVPQVYQGGTVSQAVPATQPRMTNQAQYPQTGIISQNLSASHSAQPRIVAQPLYPQTGVISQNLPVSLSSIQSRIAAQPLYPQTGVLSQNLLVSHATQPRMTAQAVYPQPGVITQTLPVSQPRMTTLYPQTGVVSPSIDGGPARMSSPALFQPTANVSQTVPGSQPRISAQPLYPQVGTLTSQPRVSGQVVYQQSVQVGTQMPLVQKNGTMVQNSVPIIVSAAPVFQNMAFQQSRQLAYQTQINSQVQPGQQFTFPSQVASNVQSPVFSQAIKNDSGSFQLQNCSVSKQININPAFIASQTQVVNQMSSVPVVQEDIASASIALDIKNDVALNQVAEDSSISYKDISDDVLSVTEKDTCETEAEQSEIVEGSGLEEPLLMPGDQQNTFITGTVMTDSRDSSIMSNLATSDIEEILLFPPAFDSETSQSSHTSMDFTDSAVNSRKSDDLATAEDGTSQQESIKEHPSTSIQAMEVTVDEMDSYIQIKPITESEDNMEGPSQTDEDRAKYNIDNDQAVENFDADSAQFTLSQNISDSVEQDFEMKEHLVSDNTAETGEPYSEMKDSDSIHSSIEACANMSGIIDTNSQANSCEDSQDAAVSSDVYMYDTYTDDSNSMTWENFHHTVLKLKANKNRDNTDVTTLKENSSERINYSSCDMGSGEPGLKDACAEKESTEIKDDGCHEQSFEGEEEEPEFIWEDFLQQTGATAVPPTAFKHVEYSLQSGFVKGMKLEVPNKCDPTTYWVATVLMTCGPLLRLRYDGYCEESSGDFWCDLGTTEIHPIGWSAQNGKNLQPPDEIRDRVSDWRTFLFESLTGARTAPSYFFEKGAGCSPVDQLKCGMKLELQDVLEPLHVWLVQILENVGGRLYLRLEGTQSACKHFWMFYLNPRLHPIGWASEHEGSIYRPPKDIYDEQTDESWAEILQAALKESEEGCVPDDVFKDQQELKPHQFAVGMKLEALNPGMNTIGPATVTKVINNLYFIVEMDDLRLEKEHIEICCNSEYLGIFPISWCQCKGIRLCPPQGWSGGDFVWGEYLSMCNAKAAPERLFNSGTDDHDFERGMKLEAVNPGNPNQICAATITKIVGPLLWIHLDHMRDIPSHIEDIDSHNLFPVGWCESNNYQLKPPIKAKTRQKHISERKTEEVYRSVTSSQIKGAWCPTIYFNHRCFSGPYLSKGRISDLPKHVGPGPMDLVLREVLSLLISIAYVPCRALKEVQQEGPYNPCMKAHILKAKYKGKKYKAIVEVCQNESQLEEFCRNTCIKLECCPYLFSPLHVRNSCPENCQQLTKTKSNPNYGKKRKLSNFISVKPSFPDDGSREPKKRGRKKKRFLYIQKKGQGQRQYDANGDLLKDEGFIDDDDEDGLMSAERKRYDIQTRGAKLPKYSFEKKSHRKILMSQATVHSDKHKQGLKRLMPKNWSTEVKHERPLLPREGSMKLESNPLHWTVNEVVQFLKTTDCSHLARIIKEQEVDGQAFLLMNLSAIQEHLELKLGPAVKLCHQIERVKLAFYENYA